MFKMQIVLDEQKMTENGYSSPDIYNRLDRIFESLNINKTSKGVFEGKGTPHDFGNFGGAIIILKRQNWFMPLVNTWLWHTDTGIEDVASHLRK